MIPTLVGVAIITFVVMRLVPGDIVALRYAGANVPQDIIDRERALLGLDKPMWAQFGDWMGQVAHLDFGKSLWTGNGIVDEVWTRVPLSIELAIIATAFAVAIALPLGVLAAVKQDTWVDYAIRVFSVGGLAMPSFWIGIMSPLRGSLYLLIEVQSSPSSPLRHSEWCPVQSVRPRPAASSMWLQNPCLQGACACQSSA